MKIQGRWKGALMAASGAVGVLVITQVLLPGDSQGRHTPTAVLFNGVIAGLLNALLAVGLILVYRSSRIINFAQGAMGAGGGVFAYNLSVLNHWPFLVSFVAGVIVAGLIGLALELSFIRRFFNSPRLVLTVVTIALLTALQQAAGFVSSLPIFPNLQDRTPEQIQGREPVVFPFAGFHFQVGSLPLRFNFMHIFAIVVSIAALLGLAYFLRFSRTGVAIRASSENSDRARLLGINVGNLSMTVWVISGVLSGLAVILSGAVSATFNAGAAPPEVLLTALAAAVLAQMTNIPTAVGSAVGLSILRDAVRWSFRTQLPLLDIGMLVVIVIGLLVQRKKLVRSEGAETSSWKATEENRPMPKEMLVVRGIRIWKWVMIGLGLVAVLGFPWVVPTRSVNLGGYVAIVAIVALSLVVLTGWTGQVSLGQFAFVAVGSILGGAIGAKFSFWGALVIVPFLTAGFSLLVGLPALRIRGLFLGITTFALAFAAHSALFNERWFGWLIPNRVDRPSLLFLDFEDERSMYYLALAGLVLVVILLATLRRTRPGRVLIALRENEPNAQSFGINAVRTRLAGFALSGFICGFAGVLLAYHQRAVQESSFQAQLSLDIFLFTVVGGVGSVSGALIGAGYFALKQFIPTTSALNFFVGQLGILILLYFAPGGLGSLVYSLRDSVLRIIAQRKQMVVPSLFADYDPLAMERKLIPLAEPFSSAGLAALPFHRRYKTSSELYRNRGLLIPDGVSVSPSGEEAAIRAAAKRVVITDADDDITTDAGDNEVGT